MHHVVTTLKPGHRGEEVRSLNKSLVRLLDEGSTLLDMKQPTLALNANQLHELINQNIEYYGPVTELLISLFQKKQRLAETGELNGETAGKLNEILGLIGPSDEPMLHRIPNQALNVWKNRLELFQIGDHDNRINRMSPPNDVWTQTKENNSISETIEGADEPIATHLLRLSIKGGEYTYAQASDIVMIESSDHFTVVHVAPQAGKVKTSLRNSCLKKVLLDLPKNYFLRVNRFCAVNLNRLSGGSYHQQFFEFDYCIKVKPRHPLSHTVFQSIGK